MSGRVGNDFSFDCVNIAGLRYEIFGTMRPEPVSQQKLLSKIWDLVMDLLT